MSAVDPTKDEKAVGDAYKTLFISRLSYRATEDDLRKEFGYYGPIERIRIVRVENGKKKGKSRGYAFILYESERDMKGENICSSTVQPLTTSIQPHTKMLTA